MSLGERARAHVPSSSSSSGAGARGRACGSTRRCRARGRSCSPRRATRAAALAELDRRPACEDLPFELARTLLVRGTLHRRLKQKRHAADALRSALEIFERLGSPPWAERARAELGRLGLRHAAPGS